jgi:hypothetical protein
MCGVSRVFKYFTSSQQNKTIPTITEKEFNTLRKVGLIINEQHYIQSRLLEYSTYKQEVLELIFGLKCSQQRSPKVRYLALH